MPPHLPQSLRERIIEWKKTMDAKEIAALAGCSLSTVYEVLRLHREYGTVNNPQAHLRPHPRILTFQDLAFIESILQANPALYLDEIQDRLLCQRGVDVSVATISRAIRRMAISWKKISIAAAERNELLRAAWQCKYGDIPKEYFVWIDESSVDDTTNQRRYGWSRVGTACVHCAAFVRGQRYSILPALTVDGIVAHDIFEGSVNKDRFIRFVEEELVSFRTAHLVTQCFIIYPRHQGSIPILVPGVWLFLITAQFTMMRIFAPSSRMIAVCGRSMSIRSQRF